MFMCVNNKMHKQQVRSLPGNCDEEFVFPNVQAQRKIVTFDVSSGFDCFLFGFLRRPSVVQLLPAIFLFKLPGSCTSNEQEQTKNQLHSELFSFKGVLDIQLHRQNDRDWNNINSVSWFYNHVALSRSASGQTGYERKPREKKTCFK